MARHYAPKAVLRHLPLELLLRFLGEQGVPTRDAAGGVSWESLTEGDHPAVYRAWVDLPPGYRERVEQMLRDVHEVATEDGVRALVAEAFARGRDVADLVEPIPGHHAKALWVLLTHPVAFHTARLLLSVARTGGRYWNLTTGFGGRPYFADRDSVQSLKMAVGRLYREQGRGHRCTVEDYLRGGCLYLFAYLDDYTVTHTAHDDHGNLVRRPLRPAFEVVYAYRRDAGTLDLYARGERRWRSALRNLFCEHILRCQPPPSPPEREYRLKPLIDRTFPLAADPARGVHGAAVRSLRLIDRRSPDRRVVLEADPARPGDVYDMVDAHFPQRRFPRRHLLVNQVVFAVRFVSGDHERPFLFTVTFPDACDLRSLPEDQRAAGEWCLRRWGILNDDETVGGGGAGAGGRPRRGRVPRAAD